MLKGTRLGALMPAMIVLAAAVAWHAGAGTAARPPATPTAVATIDIVAVFEKLNERTVLEAQLEERRKAREAQLDEVRRRIRELQSNIENIHAPGSNDSKEAIREFMEQRAVAEARANALSQIMSIDRGSIRRQLFEKIQTTIAKIAERDGIDVVFLDDSGFDLPELNASDADVSRAIVTKGILYSHRAVDITDRVITMMNNEYTAP